MNRKKNKSVLIGLLFALFLLAAFLFFKGAKTNSEISLVKSENQNCVTKIEERTVRGGSLSGLIEDGSDVKIFFGFYFCNEVKRGDIVAYNFSGDPNPIIKIAKGIPGDKFRLQETNGVWNILINGETVKNSKGESYGLSKNGSKMLSLYERDYKGVIPADAYLILGNIAFGSIDSTQFGLIGKQDILGKAELIQNGG